MSRCSRVESNRDFSVLQAVAWSLIHSGVTKTLVTEYYVTQRLW